VLHGKREPSPTTSEKNQLLLKKEEKNRVAKSNEKNEKLSESKRN
jgi:hypothetical protein